MNTVSTAAQVVEIVRAMSYPAKKWELIDEAERQGIDRESMEVLDLLPEEKFSSIQDVLSRLPVGNIELELERLL